MNAMDTLASAGGAAVDVCLYSVGACCKIRARQDMQIAKQTLL